VADAQRTGRSGKIAMTQAAKVQDSSMEDILASIRRIIADDEPDEHAAAEPGPPAGTFAAGMEDADHGEPVGPDVPANDSARPVESITELADGMRPKAPIQAVNPPADAISRGGPEPVRPPIHTGQRPADAVPVETPPSAPPIHTVQRPADVAPGEIPPAAPPIHSVERPASVAPVETPPAPAPSEPAPAVAAPPIPDRALLSPHSSAAVDMAFSSLAHTVLAQNSRTLEDLVREMLKPMLKAWLDDNLPNMVERLVRAEIERVSRGRG